jgi:pimeloyl-ACP methyl ester carboxylesterase
MKLSRLMVIAVSACTLVLVPGPNTASAGTQNPADIRCVGVQLAPAPLGHRPDLNPDGTPVKISPDRRGKFVPVIMVHGWTGSSTHTDERKGAFSHPIDLSTNQLAAVQASRSLIGQLQRVAGTAVFTFDYHDYSARWVDDSHIGPALGHAIDCLYQATGEKVIVVAHSMGGLATRYALGQPGEKGMDRAKEVSNVITFGTPETGSLAALLGDAAADYGAAANAALAVLRLLLAACGHAATNSLNTGTPCDILPPPARAADSEAGRALRTGSTQLEALMPFPAGVPTHALYGDTVFTIQKLGWFHKPWDVDKVPVGDLVVMPDSATHGVKLTQRASCSYQLSPIRGATDSIGLLIGTTAKNDVAQPVTSALGACFHGNLMRTIQLTNEATGIVNDDVSGRTPPADVIRFDGIGAYDLTMTAADLRARGFTDRGNGYTETDPECVSYAKAGEPITFSVERQTGRIFSINSGSQNMTTQVGKVRVGFTLAQLRNAFRGYRIEERFDTDFGQGTNGVIVDGGGGAIGFSLDDAPVADYSSGRVKVTFLHGVGITGHAPSNMETGC